MPHPSDPFASGPEDEELDDPFTSSELSELPRKVPPGSYDPFDAQTDRTLENDPFAVPVSGSEERWNAPKPGTRSAGGRRLLFTVVSLLTILGIAAFSVVTRSDSEQQAVDIRADGEVRGNDAVGTHVAEPPGATTQPQSTPESTAVPATLPATTVVPESVTPESTAPDPTTTEVIEAEAETLLGCDLRTDDPHHLIRITDDLDRLAFCGEETWQVFVCSTRESDRTDRVAYVDDVLGEAAEWFEWASAGQYDIDFSAGDDTRAVSGSTAEPQECFEEVLQNQWSGSRSGAVVLVDETALDPFQNYVGLGTCGYVSSAAGGVFGESGRMVAIAVHARGDQSAIAVHELGHAQCWPHSYSGDTGSEYDNPADVMSFSQNWPVGTIAVNRYASGWIHPGAVRVHSDATDTYTLSPCCSGGVQLLALLPEDASAHTVDFNRRWWHLEVRDPEDEWELGLADAEVGGQIGVSVHWIDQSLGMGAERRQAQVGDRIDVRRDAPIRFDRLMVAGSEFCLHVDQPTSLTDCASVHEWRIEVTASQTGGLNLAVSPSA